MSRTPITYDQHTKRRQHEQNALREHIAQRATVDDILINVETMERSQLSPQEFNQLKAATEIRLKLLNKYLPDLKASEGHVEGEQVQVVIDVTQYARLRQSMLEDDDC